MKEVYVVFSDYTDDDYNIEAVFTSKQHADQYLMELGLDAMERTEPRKYKIYK